MRSLRGRWKLPDTVTHKTMPPRPVSARCSVFVRNLVLAAKIGVHPHEKVRPPRLRISVDLEMADNPPVRDELDAALDYERVVADIRKLAAARHINLVETFADAVARICLSDPRVSCARVTVEKLDVYPDAESVGVTLERRSG